MNKKNIINQLKLKLFFSTMKKNPKYTINVILVIFINFLFLNFIYAETIKLEEYDLDKDGNNEIIKIEKKYSSLLDEKGLFLVIGNNEIELKSQNINEFYDQEGNKQGLMFYDMNNDNIEEILISVDVRVSPFFKQITVQFKV